MVNWDSLISSAFASVINGLAVFLSIRYVGKAADHLESRHKKSDKHGNTGNNQGSGDSHQGA